MTTGENGPRPLESPRAVFYFRVYAALLSFAYLNVIALGILYLAGVFQDDEMSALGNQILGAIMLALGAVCFTAFLLAVILTKPRPWLWTYDLVMICVGMTSACCLPVCIPLLIYWLKPEIKQYFGRV